jgi:hypothetical protein
MGPLSAVAIVFFLVFFGLAGIAWITVSAHALGIIALLAAAVVLLDVFWFNSGRRYSAWRDR